MNLSKLKMFGIGIITCLWYICLGLIGIAQFNQAATLKCYKGSLDNPQEVPLEAPLPLLNSTCVNASLPTVLYAFGFTQSAESELTIIMLTALLNNSSRNLILLDWEQEASDGGLGDALGYTSHAFPNVEKVGNKLGQALVTLVGGGLNPSVQLLGLSMGAHVVGIGGRWAGNNGFVVPRVTGLDPAGPVFDTPGVSRLDSTSGKFVDSLHTNAGRYGTIRSACTVDFWANLNVTDLTQLSQNQPGCPPGIATILTDDGWCSHRRAVLLYAEAEGSPEAFPAAGPTNYLTWSTGQATTNYIYLGELVDTRVRGKFYLKTNANSPYGKGQDGLKP